MPKLPQNIIRRKGSSNYQFRAAVPVDLQARFGKEVRISLKTTDLKLARAKAAKIAAELNEKYHRARQREAIRQQDVAIAARKLYQELVESDHKEREERKNIPRQTYRVTLDHSNESFHAIYDPHAEARLIRGSRLSSVIDALARDSLDMEALQRAVEYAKSAGWDLQGNTEGLKALAMGFLRAEREALQRAAERDQGKLYGKPEDTLLTSPLAAVAPVEGTGELSLLDAFERYAKLKSGSTSPNFIEHERSAIRVLDLFLGGDAPATSISKRTLGQFRDALLEWPSTARFIDQEGRTFSDVVELAREKGLKPISGKTINGYLDTAKRLAKYLASIDEIPEFDASSIRVARRKTDHHRAPFSAIELRAFFSQPVFSDPTAPGWKRWAPIAALHSGMRLAEILQLQFDDIRQDNDTGVWLFDIRSGAGKSLKTRAAERLVPIHSRLITLGFLDHIAARKAEGGARPFAETTRHPSKGFNYASNFFSRLIRSSGIEGKVFHGFRSTFIDALRAADIMPSEIKPLVGHETGDVTRGYGRLPTGTVSRRKEIVESAQFDLPNLAGLAG